jgi:tetratricopeptide (TPR) repeat protein
MNTPRILSMYPSRAAALLLLLASAAAAADSAVQLREESLVIPTCQVGPAQHNPIFYSGRSYQGAKGPVYPYPLLDKLTDQRVDKTYRAIYFENRYVRFSILPEIGGRIFTGCDKTNGYDFIYRQHVVKPALIGMLGAWISGGVEWNIPHHHRASTFATVDCTTEGHADGSKTIWVGETELRHHMKWLVSMTLRPDRSYLEVTVKLFNRTPLPHSLLYFANIAVHANENYQVCFPPSTALGTQHAKREFVHWPIGQEVYGGLDRRGVDLSWWKNHPVPASIFAWNYEDDFFGGYDHGRKAGIAILADHHVAPGKKFFLWGNGPEGRLWDKILTDTDGPYLELMAGAYSDNQPDYSWCQPYETKVVTQYWYPTRELGGLKNANLDAAVNLDIDPTGTARIALNTTAEFRDAHVLLEAQGKGLFEKRIVISPEKPFVDRLPLPAGAKAEDVRVSLRDSMGRELIAYQPRKLPESPMPEPVQPPPPPPPKEVATNDELCVVGLRLEQFYNPALEPYPYYEEALRRDPGDCRANTALGILGCKCAMYVEAETRLKAAVARSTKNYTRPKDTEALYYLGIALQAQGKDAEAVDAFQRAAWSGAWHSAANFALAELACRRGDLGASLVFIDRAISGNTANPKLWDFKAALLRRLGRLADAKAAIAAALALDPLDFWARNEQSLCQQATASAEDRACGLQELERLMRGEVQSYLELAADYTNCGLWDEAIDVLNRYVRMAANKARVDPMVHYHLAWLYDKWKEPQKAREQYRLAGQMPPDYCFPSRLESIDVLQSAMKANPRDARAAYYLGNLLYDLQPERAIAAWEQSRGLDPEFATVHRNLGLAYAQAKSNLGRAVASLERAVACDPRDPKLYAELDAMYEASGFAPEKRYALLSKNHATVAQRDDSLLREIRLAALLGQFDRAINLIEHHHFHSWEGEGGVHDVYADAHLGRARQFSRQRRHQEALRDCEAALKYPENLESARAHRSGREVQIYCLMGKARAAMGDQARARQCFQQAGAAWSNKADPQFRYWYALACRELGDEARADEAFESLSQSGREMLAKGPPVDFFSKFGSQQSTIAHQASAHYLLGLGYLGQRRTSDAKREFDEAVRIDPSHFGAHLMAAELH